MTEPNTAGLSDLTAREQTLFLRSRRMSQRFRRAPRLFSRANRVLFRLTGGHIGGKLLGSPIGLLSTTGRRSGQSRTVPIVYLDDGSRLLVVASNSGLDESPAWYLNLRATPNAQIRTRTSIERVVARELTGHEREELWPRLLEHNAMWGAYQACTRRQCGVIALERSQSQEEKRG